MGTRQIERLYKKMITFEAATGGQGIIDPRIRAEIFQAIMDDMESTCGTSCRLSKARHIQTAKPHPRMLRRHFC